MNSAMDEINMLHQAQRHHHMVVRGGGGGGGGIGEEIDLQIGLGDDDDPSFSAAGGTGGGGGLDDDHKALLLTPMPPPLPPPQQLGQPQSPAARKKKKVVKKWREEWADTYRWAYVAAPLDGSTSRVFCSVCKEYGRKHRRNPYGNEGSRNMQMSALEEHNNSLLHKEALRLQAISKQKAQQPPQAADAVVAFSGAVASSERSPPLYMTAYMSKTGGSIIEAVLKRDHREVEFIQSIQEVVHSLEPVLVNNPQYLMVLERLLEPERSIIFRVPWVDDKGEAHVNRGFRVQFSRSLGPCRGCLRFHTSMNLSVAKFLGFEQTLKNALSLYKLGGASGGSDFDPKGKSDNEIMRFCQSFMDELYRYFGPDQDLPIEDIGVGPREMGFLFGQYKRLSGHFQGNFTGPKIFWPVGPSLRTEATGYGLVFFARLMLAKMNKELKGLRCVISGFGKIAMHVMEKLLSCGAIPVTLSDSQGYLLDDEGFDFVKCSLLRDIKAQQRSLKEYLKSYPRARYVEDAKPWGVQCNIAFPCATQTEIDQADAIALVNSGCQVLIEGSNMPCTSMAADILRKSRVLVAPAKATGAGGVVAGELELSREFNLTQWPIEDFENKIAETMKQTYERSLKVACEYGIAKDDPDVLVQGANIAAFLNLAQVMMDQGCV